MTLSRGSALLVHGAVLTLLARGAASAAPPAPPVKREAPPQKVAARLDQIEFVDPVLARRFRTFARVAAQSAPEGWNRQPLIELPAFRNRPLLYWQSWTDPAHTIDNYLIWQRRERPSAGIILGGRGKSQNSRAVTVVNLHFWSMPKAGWGAGTHYECLFEEGAIREGLAVRLFAADTPSLSPVGTLEFPLFRLRAAKDYPKSRFRRYGVTVSLPEHGPENGYWSSYPLGNLPLDFVGSDEEFLRAALDNLRALERSARETIPAGSADFTVIDYTAVRSDHPPREERVSERTTPTEAQRRGLLDAILLQVRANETLVKTHYREMSAAVRRRFPLQAALQAAEKR